MICSREKTFERILDHKRAPLDGERRMGLFPIRPAWITYLRQSNPPLPNAHLLNGKAVAVGQQAVEVSLGVAEVGAYAAQAAKVVVVLGAAVGVEPSVEVLGGVLALDKGNLNKPLSAFSMLVLRTTAWLEAISL